MINRALRTILYVGNFFFPDGNAAGKRVYENGKLLREIGYDVIYVGVSKENGSFSRLSDTGFVFDGFTCYNFPYPTKGSDWLKYSLATKAIQQLILHQKHFSKPILIIFYGSPTISFFMAKMLRFCRSNNVIAVSDAVDWLTPQSTNILWNIIKWIDTNYQCIIMNKKMDGIIAISSFFAEYYQQHKVPIVILPPLSSGKCLSTAIHKMNTVPTLVYAGIWPKIGKPIRNPRKLKDRIDKTIELLSGVKDLGIAFELHIYGFSAEEYMKSLPQQKAYVDRLGSSLIFHGKVSNSEVLEAVSAADFTILLRDVSRDTMAGFPTKISESIGCGTPAITTRTSDIEKYIEEGKSGYFLDFDLDTARKQLSEILKSVTTTQREDTRRCTINPFDTQHYIQKARIFLDDIIDRQRKN